VTRSRSLSCLVDPLVPASCFIREVISYGAAAAPCQELFCLQPFGMSSFDFSHLLGPVFAGAGILAPVTMQVHLLFWAPITLLLVGWVTEGRGGGATGAGESRQQSRKFVVLEVGRSAVLCCSVVVLVDGSGSKQFCVVPKAAYLIKSHEKKNMLCSGRRRIYLHIDILCSSI
jgi:hypothetical protein